MIHPVLAPPRFRWVMLPLLAVIVLAALWTAFWLYAASVAEATISRWREQEGKAGRTYTCASQTAGGYPFRIEVRCSDAAMEVRSAQPAFVVRAKDLLVVAQVYQPSLLIGEIAGPLTVAESGRLASLVATWDVAQASIRGRPSAPERVSIAIDGLKLARDKDTGGELLGGAQHIELHSRFSPGASVDNPTLDLTLRVVGGTAPAAGTLTVQPLDAEVTAVLRGIKNFSPQPIVSLLRDFQAAGGRIDIQNARVQQGEGLARATGSLGLTASGRLDGMMLVTVVGFERFVASQGGWQQLLPPASAPNRTAPALSALDRFAPALGGAARNRVETSILGLLGEQTQLEGKPAVALPLRFTDGAAFLGPIPLGGTPPLY